MSLATLFKSPKSWVTILNVFSIAVAVVAEPLFLFLGAFCADGSPTKTQMYTCAATLGFLPVIVAVVSLLLSRLALRFNLDWVAVFIAASPIILGLGLWFKTEAHHA